VQTQAFRDVVPWAGQAGVTVPESAVLRGEQSNTSLVCGDRCVLKLFRKPEAGRHPDFEIGRFLTEKAAFTHAPRVGGAIEYRFDDETRTVAVLSEFVANEGDAWRYTVDELGHYFERVAAGAAVPVPAGGGLIAAARTEPPAEVVAVIGPYLDAARLLGQRTAELHVALASDPADPDFAPEPFTAMYQRSIYQSVRSTARGALQTLRRNMAGLDAAARPMAERVAAAEDDLLGRLRPLLEGRINTARIRSHGDYHLGQVLWTGKDFVIIDFEGEPARPLSERRHKRPALRDVAGMLRSFDYAALVALADHTARGLAPAPDLEARLRAGARRWTHWVSASFLAGYLTAAGAPPARRNRSRGQDTPIVPSEPRAAQLLLDAYLIDKAAYELGYELNNRPAWAWIPLTGLLALLGRLPA
jgi:maltose alpha-D-glucosyltransferase / alpha-amylase